jgi:hypothetical protein
MKWYISDTVIQFVNWKNIQPFIHFSLIKSKIWNFIRRMPHALTYSLRKRMSTSSPTIGFCQCISMVMWNTLYIFFTGFRNDTIPVAPSAPPHYHHKTENSGIVYSVTSFGNHSDHNFFINCNYSKKMGVSSKLPKIWGLCTQKKYLYIWVLWAWKKYGLCALINMKLWIFLLMVKGSQTGPKALFGILTVQSGTHKLQCVPPWLVNSTKINLGWHYQFF